MEIKEKKLQIEEAMKYMKAKEALVLKLFYLHENSIVEIEEITGFCKSNVKVLLHRARVSFSQLFKLDTDE